MVSDEKNRRYSDTALYGRIYHLRISDLVLDVRGRYGANNYKIGCVESAKLADNKNKVMSDGTREALAVPFMIIEASREGVGSGWPAALRSSATVDKLANPTIGGSY